MSFCAIQVSRVSVATLGLELRPPEESGTLHLGPRKLPETLEILQEISILIAFIRCDLLVQLQRPFRYICSRPTLEDPSSFFFQLQLRLQRKARERGKGKVTKGKGKGESYSGETARQTS